MVQQQSLEAQYQHKKSLLVFDVEFCSKEANLNSEMFNPARAAFNTVGLIFFKYCMNYDQNCV